MTHAANLVPCPACAGRGTEHDGDAWQETPCPRCEGTGQVPQSTTAAEIRAQERRDDGCYDNIEGW
jgi:DnaJ-class molecular chaperone